jgi:hypothetical protein
VVHRSAVTKMNFKIMAGTVSSMIKFKKIKLKKNPKCFEGQLNSKGQTIYKKKMLRKDT